MPKPTLPFNDAVRQLLERHEGNLTYASARPELEKIANKMGFELASTEDDMVKERQRFDATKFNWGKTRESGEASPSQRPRNVKNTKAREAGKRGRGRPRKEEVESGKRGRGRPRKEVVESGKRGRGRPRKSPAPKSPAPKYTPTTGRRGRPRKVEPIHDLDQLVAYLDEHGGEAAVRKEIDNKRAQAAQLIAEAEKQERMLAEFDELRKRLSKLAA